MKNYPIVTNALVVINVAIHLLLIFYSFFIKQDFMLLQEIYLKYGLVPADFWNGAVWQPFTAIFLHGFYGFSLHLIVNMIALMSLGKAIEITIGSIPFTWLYFISGLFGSLFVVVFQPDLSVPTIGASGAIMGLLAALAIFYPSSMLLVFFFPMKARTAAILFGLGSLVLALFDKSSSISHFGHLGGFIGGFLYTKLALNLKIGKNQLSIFKSTYEEELERELLEKMSQIEKLREEYEAQKSKRTILDSLFFDEEDIENKKEEPIKEKKIYYDPKTGKFYIIE
ncbi:MAG: rhomboid family intramembrane serine protease [Leptonema sp. (in: bacteria)]